MLSEEEKKSMWEEAQSIDYRNDLRTSKALVNPKSMQNFKEYLEFVSAMIQIFGNHSKQKPFIKNTLVL